MKRIFLLRPLFFLIMVISVPAQDAASLIARGDELYQLRVDVNKAKEAMAKYQEALKIGGKNYEALWKISKILYTIGKAAKTDSEKMKIFKEGENYAKKAIAVNPNGADGHFWLGVHYGKYGEARGVLKSLFLADDIKDEMRKVIAADESYEGAGAHRVLGRVYFKLPGIAGGSNRKSRLHLEKARQLCPANTLTLLYLAETYWDMDLEKEAIKTLEQLLATVPDLRWIPETAEDKVAAEKLLKKYKK